MGQQAKRTKAASETEDGLDLLSFPETMQLLDSGGIGIGKIAVSWPFLVSFVNFKPHIPDEFAAPVVPFMLSKVSGWRRHTNKIA